MDPSCTTLGSTFPDQRNPERTTIGGREFVASPLPRGQEAGPRILPLAGEKEPELISPRFKGSTAGIWVSTSINCVSLALRRRSLVG